MISPDTYKSRSKWLAVRGWAVAMLFVAIMSVRIVDTHKVFSATNDESVHIAAGVELLTLHRYTFSPEHTPVARIPASVGPVLAGTRLPVAVSRALQADSVMRSGPGYRKNLELARLGILPFFIVGGVFLFAWARHLAGESVAVVSVFLYSLTPSVLAHSGLATTDAAAMASFVALMFAFQLWLERPHSLKRTVWFGIAAGVAVGSKISAIPFFGATALLTILAYATANRRGGIRPAELPALRVVRWRFGLAVVIGLLTLYATYGLTMGRALGFPAPLSEFVFGLMLILRHSIDGNASYLLGETYLGRRWEFFPVAIAVKTPIPLLVLAMGGLFVATRRWWRRREVKWVVPLAAVLAPLGVACASQINLGTRHLLPIFPSLALLGGICCVELWRTTRLARGLVTVLCVWMLVWTWRAHPDYLAYFNELVGDDPGAVLVESDLDWGQDLERLADTVRARGISDLSIAYFGSGDRISQLLPNARQVGPGEARPSGWFAVSETRYRMGWMPRLHGRLVGTPDSLTWLQPIKPVTRVGSSIRLYFLPPLSTTP